MSSSSHLSNTTDQLPSEPQYDYKFLAKPATAGVSFQLKLMGSVFLCRFTLSFLKNHFQVLRLVVQHWSLVACLFVELVLFFRSEV